jgi:hypothetical protein
MDLLYTMLTFVAFSFVAIFLTICFIMMKIFKGKSIGDPKYAPVKGTAFNQLFHFNKLYDYQAQMAKIHPTYRLLSPNQSDLYTIDVRNIEHILKTNFDKYSRGKHSQDIMIDLFGEGIFAVDGDKWKQQRKVASYEFSTRVLRDFSCSVFRKNAAKLVRVISEFYHEGLPFDMQVSSYLYYILSNIIIYFLKLLLLRCSIIYDIH